MGNEKPSGNQQEVSLFSDVLGDMVKVFSAISNEDSLKIFYAARDGIESSTKVIRELGLTQKRYYTRLNELIKAGLLEKGENFYQYTTLGKLCYKLGELFTEALGHSEQLELIDKVKSSSSLSITEKEKIVQALSKEGLTDFVDLLSGGVRSVGIVTNFEDIIAGIMRLIEKAQKNIYLATRYTDVNVAETILEGLNRGVEMYFLDGDRENLSSKTQLLRLILSNPLKIKLFYQLFHSSHVHVRYVDLPYSFVVVDNRYVGVELLDPLKNEFFVGLFLENDSLANKFIEIFHMLYEKAVEDPMKAFIKETKV